MNERLEQGVKFGRAYRLVVRERDPKTKEVLDEVIITNPITIRFTCSRHTSNALNELRVDLYNLSENVRTFLFQEIYTERNKEVTLEGGYDELSTMFVGKLWSGFSQRQGSDIVTTLWAKVEVWTLNNATVYTSMPAQSSVKDVLGFLLGQFGVDLPIGAIGEYPETLLRPTVLNGNVYKLAQEYSDNSVYVDNGRVYALRANEALEGDITLINDTNGLLATPKRDTNMLQIQILFEPRIVMKQWLRVESDVQDVYTGNYQVFGIQHTGIISEAVGGDLRTILDLGLEGQGYRVVKKVE